MDKTLKEEDLKLLEEEIDSAVDRLFVPKQGEAAEGSSVESPLLRPSSRVGESPKAFTTPSFEPMDPSILELSSEMEKSLGPVPEPPLVQDEPVRWGESLQINQPVGKEEPMRMEEPRPVPPAAVSAPDTLEKLETQLLSLEWEITKENLERTSREVLALKEGWGGGAEASPVLGLMGKVLDIMMHQGESISPRLINFLGREETRSSHQQGRTRDEDLRKLWWRARGAISLSERSRCPSSLPAFSGKGQAGRTHSPGRPRRAFNRMNYFERLIKHQRINHRLSTLAN
jgi:hypothetical protein